jgi:hypothetical protein
MKNSRVNVSRAFAINGGGGLNNKNKSIAKSEHLRCHAHNTRNFVYVSSKGPKLLSSFFTRTDEGGRKMGRSQRMDYIVLVIADYIPGGFSSE